MVVHEYALPPNVPAAGCFEHNRNIIFPGKDTSPSSFVTTVTDSIIKENPLSVVATNGAAVPGNNILVLGCEEDEFQFYRYMIQSSKYSMVYNLFGISDIREIDNLIKNIEIKLMMVDISATSNLDYSIFKELHKKYPAIPKIIMTDFEDEEAGLNAIRCGAQDYLVKEIVNSYSLNRSITYSIERARIEKTLRDNYEALESFSHVAAHDLKSPLHTISSCFSIILDEEEERKIDPETVDLLKRSAASASRMSKLIDDLLDYARSGRASAKIEEVSLYFLLRDVVADINAQKQVVVKNLPHIEGDYNQLYQLFLNLIQNGLKFVPEGVTPEIEVYAKPLAGDNHFVQVLVKDNGIGISEEDCKRIFDPFTRLSSKFSGTGIGLATCKKIVMNHRGHIRVSSKPCRGSTFIITFPLKQYK